MKTTRKCRHCGREYQYETAPNVIAFCPLCRRLDLLQSEQGFGPIAPCRIYLGEEPIGLVTYSNCSLARYDLIAGKYGIRRQLEGGYDAALDEAAAIIAEQVAGV